MRYKVIWISSSSTNVLTSEWDTWCVEGAVGRLLGSRGWCQWHVGDITPWWKVWGCRVRVDSYHLATPQRLFKTQRIICISSLLYPWHVIETSVSSKPACNQKNVVQVQSTGSLWFPRQMQTLVHCNISTTSTSLPSSPTHITLKHSVTPPPRSRLHFIVEHNNTLLGLRLHRGVGYTLLLNTTTL